MKPIRIVLSPTRSRPVNMFLGLVLMLVALLLFLALATFHASDPSLNTATDSAVARNWVGLFGAYLSDVLMQSLGLTAFLLPLWLGGVGWTWMRSRPGGSPILRWMGSILTLVFLPAVFGLLPWHWRWLHIVPVEGVVGRLVAGLLVVYLNIQGAWLVAAALAACGLYFASAISFWVIRESFAERWAQLSAWLENWRNRRLERNEARREVRAEQRAEREALQVGQNPPVPFPKLVTRDELDEESEPPARRPNRFLAFFTRRRATQQDPLDEIPAYQRKDLRRESEEPAEAAIPITQRRPSIWERREPETAMAAPATVPAAAAAPLRPMQVEPAAARTVNPWPIAKPEPIHEAPQLHSDAIAIHDRADAQLRTVTIAPKNVSGFKLPPSSLLSAGEAPQSVREDELREEAKVLVEKCAEFDVRGQVVQINPGPMVTTFEFKPEAGVKYSRVTGLADDLCLAMRAESILIERMAGKSTVGIQVPNHERETIHLRDVIESETFVKARSRLTLAMGKDINGRIVTADLASMPHVLIAGRRARESPWPSTP